MKTTLALFLLFLSSSSVFAQNEVLRELSSLSGISEFGVVVNIEIPEEVEAPNLTPGNVREGILEYFEELPIRILNDNTLRQSDQYPILHVHINVMKASNYTYPFSIEWNFYQPVKLVLKGDLISMASTWNKGQVGIVSHDNLEMIAEEAVYSALVFKEEFIQMN